MRFSVENASGLMVPCLICGSASPSRDDLKMHRVCNRQRRSKPIALSCILDAPVKNAPVGDFV